METSKSHHQFELQNSKALSQAFRGTAHALAQSQPATTYNHSIDMLRLIMYVKRLDD